MDSLLHNQERDEALADRLARRLGAEVEKRWTPEGLPPRPGLQPRIDATAWVVLALGADAKPSSPALEILGRAQQEDGRIPAREDTPEAYWTTGLASLAFGLRGEAQRSRRDRALDFLSTHEGIHHPRTEETPVSHDTDLVGWPWIEGSAAWVEPTALAHLALTRSGRGDHLRAVAARALLFDRQLPGAGWNHGNVKVLGKPFRSVVSSTGLVLLSLAGMQRDDRINSALEYLRSATAVTPLSLAWRRIGLAAWGEPSDCWPFYEAVERSTSLGPLDGAHLCQLILALEGPARLLGRETTP